MRSRRVLSFPSVRHVLPPLGLLALLAIHPAAARASVHLNEITKVMVGLNGNPTIQAVEIKMLAAGQQLTGGASIKVYDAAGALVATLGTFTGPVPTGTAGRRILCATHNFAVAFGITPDLEISPGLLVGTGQVAFEAPSCPLVNAIAYGAVTPPKNGPTSAPSLPNTGASILVRSIDDLTTPFCPLTEDAAARFSLVNATAGSPVTFTNNFGDFVQVYATAAGVDGDAPGATRLQVYPNPFFAGARIIAPGFGYVAIYDSQGRKVRSWGSPNARPAVVGPMRLDWDGRDHAGRRLASGIYFVRYGTSSVERTRVLLLR